MLVFELLRSHGGGIIHCAGAQLGAEQKGGRQQVWGPMLQTPLDGSCDELEHMPAEYFFLKSDGFYRPYYCLVFLCVWFSFSLSSQASKVLILAPLSLQLTLSD